MRAIPRFCFGHLGSSGDGLRTSAPGDLVENYASGSSAAVPRDGFPVAQASRRSRFGVSCVMRTRDFCSTLPSLRRGRHNGLWDNE
jgi:hypothetical protein